LDDRYQCFGGTYCPNFRVEETKIEAADSSEVERIYKTT
jgi:hypothetical protein